MGTFPVTYQLSFNSPAEFNQINGVIYNDSSIRISSITDGTSNTILFAEHARTNLMTYDPGFGLSDGQWNSGRIYDTMFADLVSAERGLSGGNAVEAPRRSSPAASTRRRHSSQHPGGVNVALCDGSVRFIKNSISSWSFDPTTNMPLGVSLVELRLHGRTGSVHRRLAAALDQERRRGHQRRCLLRRPPDAHLTA